MIDYHHIAHPDFDYYRNADTDEMPANMKEETSQTPTLSEDNVFVGISISELISH